MKQNWLMYAKTKNQKNSTKVVYSWRIIHLMHEEYFKETLNTTTTITITISSVEGRRTTVHGPRFTVHGELYS